MSNLTFLASVVQLIMGMGHSDFELAEAKKMADKAKGQKHVAVTEFSKAIEGRIEQRNERAYDRVVNGR